MNYRKNWSNVPLSSPAKKANAYHRSGVLRGRARWLSPCQNHSRKSDNNPYVANNVLLSLGRRLLGTYALDSFLSTACFVQGKRMRQLLRRVIKLERPSRLPHGRAKCEAGSEYGADRSRRPDRHVHQRKRYSMHRSTSSSRPLPRMNSSQD